MTAHRPSSDRAAAGNVDRPASSDKPSKILVVDDEPDLQPLIRQRLRRSIRAGLYEFSFASNGVEALEQLEQDRDIKLVLSDINMPKMDGLTLLQQIPKIDPDIRAVIISAYGDMGNIRTAMNRGAFDFVTKPVDFKDLAITIDRALENLSLWLAALSARDQLVALQNELDIARRLQQSILPTTFPAAENFNVSASMKPARNVGGDFYDVLELGNGKIGITIADVSDKGVSSALFMMAARTVLKGAAMRGGNPGAIMAEANDLLCADNPDTMFVTVFYGEYDPASGVLDYANAGHDQPLVVSSDGQTRVLPTTGGIAMGVFPGFEYKSATLQLEPGDSFVSYTDGVTDATSDGSDQFGLDRLREVLASNPPTAADAAIAAVTASVDDFSAGHDQFDDITCLALCRISGD